MNKKIIGAIIILVFISLVYLVDYVFCIVSQNYVSPEEYARMARNIVEQSVQQK